MITIFFDEHKNIIRYINGKFYERPFINDLVIIQGKTYQVLQTTIDYDDNQLIVLVRLV
jgi:hypothetical protein